MRFELTQRFNAAPDAVAAAFCDPGFYEALNATPGMGDPKVVSRETEGENKVHLQVRYKFTGELSPPARAVLDPAKLVWVDDSHHDLAAREVTFRLLPDHYADRFKASGRYWFEATDQASGVTLRRAEGDIKVKALVVGGAVERAILSGLKERLDDEVAVLERYLAGS
jgi:hypothetical protein